MSKVLIVFGTRPELIKLAPVAAAIAALPGVTLRTCSTGQHQSLLDPVLTAFGLMPDIAFRMMAPGQSLEELAARMLPALGEVMAREAPDLVIVQGDTSTAMIAALAAHYRQIPVGHVEAGLRSGDLSRPWPEEAHRRMIAVLAEHHWAPTESAAAALLREGVAADRIRVTGNTGIDALIAMRHRVAAEPTLTAAIDPLLARGAGRRILLVTAHRRENHDGGIAAIALALHRLAKRDDVAIVVVGHPNPAAAALGTMLAGHANVIVSDPLDYPCLVRALDACHVVLTDSGGLQEEAPSFGKPLLVLRETTERPEGVEMGTAMLVGTDTTRIITAASHLLDDPTVYAAMALVHHSFGDGQAAIRIAAHIAHILSTDQAGAAITQRSVPSSPNAVRSPAR